MDMTGLNRLAGLPVILNGRAAGSVMRGVLGHDGQALEGLVIRGGLRGARWLDASQIELLGRVSVLAHGKTSRVPKRASYKLFRVSDTDGQRVGVVSDALVCETSLRVRALEISQGPVDDMLGGRYFATAYSVRPAGRSGHVTLLSNREGKEATGENG